MNKQQLASRIWESANAMRSKIEANEYKDYILGFIFYKFLSDNLEAFLIREGVERSQLAAVLDDDNLDTVEYVQNNMGYFISYENLYSTWLSKGADFNVGDVRDALAAFDRMVAPTEKHLFNNIFDTLQTGLSKLGDTATSQTKAIRELLKLIKDIPMGGRQGYDVLGFIYEYLISNFAANAGKKAGEFYTPHEVSLLMSQIIAKHLAGRSEIQIYDPTSGSGSLLLNIGQAVAHQLGDHDRIKYYAQELKSNTYNLTRMNLVMRGIKPDNIITRNADSLEQDWPIFDESDPQGTYQPLYVDAVVSNPPYSQHWSPAGKGSDPRYARFGLAPDSKADYAFLLHDLFHVRPDGIMTIVLPHGVLFRGGAESVIRRRLIEENHIDTIIGLPANIFFGTGIPTIIMVLKQKRDRDDVLFIDASQNFLKVGKNNQLRASDIRRIGDAVERRVDAERFARVVSRAEIRDNDYNLNIPRYISATAPAEPVDLYATMYGGVPESELDSLSGFWSVLPGLRESLFTQTRAGQAQLAVEDIDAAIDAHQSVSAFRAATAAALVGLDDELHDRLVRDRAGVSVVQAEEELIQAVFGRLTPVPLVDEYDAFQILHDLWAQIAIDLEVIQTEGEDAIRRIEPRLVMKKIAKTKETTEVQEGWQGRVIPFQLAQRHYLPDLLSTAQELEERLTALEDELAAMFEGFTEDQLTDLNDVLNEEGTAFAKTALSKNVVALKRTRQTFDEDSPEAIQMGAKELLDEQAAVKKQQKAAASALESETRKVIESLTPEQIDELLVAKWIEPLMSGLGALPDRVLSLLSHRVSALKEKYATSMGELTQQIGCTERELSGLLSQLRGSDTDNEALDVLRGLLGGSHE